MTVRDRPHVVIVGGGIGGMTASIALRNEGFRTEVFERQREFSALGVGVILCTNAIKSFGALGRGVRDAVIAGGSKITDDFLHRGHFHNDDAFALRGASNEGPTLEEEFGAPQVAIRRSQLLEILVKAHGPEGLHTGAECVAIEKNGDRVAATFADRRRVEGDVLVGADGLGSVVRAALHGDVSPEYSGWSSLRGLTPGFELPADLREGVTLAGNGTGMLAVPVVEDRGIIYWSASVRVPEGSWPYDDARRARSLLLERIVDWPLLPAIVGDADPASLVAREHRDRPPLDEWGAGRVTLLGDAAHPMTNMWGQGAATATEDGVILSRCLAREPSDPEAALRRFEQLRIPRTSRIVLASHAYGDRGTNPVQFTNWLYSYDAACEPLIG
jgi:2-polyprenyl-6-methoxyphenol hydroxylase-like FAD-dependent oxidoreductase